MYPFIVIHLIRGRQLLLPLLIFPFLLFSCEAVDSDREFPVSDRDKLARFNDDEFVKANADYFEAWELALWYEGGLRADPEEAVRFLDHLELIRNRYGNELPEVEEAFTLPWVPGSLIIGADIRHIEDVQDGFFRDFNQLDLALVPDSVAFLDFEPGTNHFFFLAYFDDLLNVGEMARIFRQLPDVRFADPDYLSVFAGNPFSIYPGHIDGDFYYLFYRTTFVTERTTLIKVEPAGLQGWQAELITSFVPGEQPPSEADDIIRQIRSDFNNRFLDPASVDRMEELRARISAEW